ncbi:MAG: hypothetical protein M3A44_04370 [Gammaproteobacteria bacterium]
MDYSNALTVFDVGLHFMQGLGFKGPQVCMETSKLAGDSLLLTYDSETAGRQVEVSYLRAQRGRPAAIVVFIVANSGKRFSVEDWLAVNGKANAIEFSTLNNPGLSESLFIERFCHDFMEICDQKLRDILTGTVWQDVPIDWKGYR